MLSDCISRKAALKILNSVIIRYDELKPKYELIIIKSAMEKMADEIYKSLLKLPPVVPERNKGKWLPHMVADRYESIDHDVCSECHTCYTGEPIWNWKYCPVCGAEMEDQDA